MAAKKTRNPPAGKAAGQRAPNAPRYPRHAPDKALRIPRAILEQNAGKDCSDAEAVGFLGLKLSGALRTEISSGDSGFSSVRRRASSE